MFVSIEEQIKKIPQDPGVYRYYDVDGKLLYIGKAKNLKKRVLSYFIESKVVNSRIRLLIRKISKIEYTIVPSEKDAFLLENSLIKQFQPKYNIQLKDDKTFPYIVIVKEPFPRIFLTRNKKKRQIRIFWPIYFSKVCSTNVRNDKDALSN
jgi:excinuclease ABC subunit C